MAPLFDRLGMSPSIPPMRPRFDTLRETGADDTQKVDLAKVAADALKRQRDQEELDAMHESRKKRDLIVVGILTFVGGAVLLKVLEVVWTLVPHK